MSSLASTTAASSCASRTQTSLGLCLVLPMKLQRRSSGRAYRPTRAPPPLRQEEARTALTRRASGCPCTAPSLDTTLALICRNTLRCCCRYKQAAADLVSGGHAYPCFCDTHRLEAAKAAALAKGVSYKYLHTPSFNTDTVHLIALLQVRPPLLLRSCPAGCSARSGGRTTRHPVTSAVERSNSCSGWRERGCGVRERVA